MVKFTSILLITTFIVIIFSNAYSADYSIIDKNGYISAQNVRMRKEPSIKSDIIGYAKIGYKFSAIKKTNTTDTVDGVKDYWYYNGKVWVFGKFVVFDKEFDLINFIINIKNESNQNMKKYIGNFIVPSVVVGNDGSTASPNVGYNIYDNCVLKYEWSNEELYEITLFEENNEYFIITCNLIYNNYDIIKEKDLKIFTKFKFMKLKNNTYSIDDREFVIYKRKNKKH